MAAPAELLARLLRQGLVVALMVMLGVAGGVLYARLASPTYVAEAHVVVLSVQPTDDTTPVKFAQAYGRIATEPAVLADAASTVRGGSIGELRRHLRVSTSPDAPLVQLTGSAGTAQQAAEVANEVATALVKFGNSRTADTRVRLATFAEATPPERPSSPNGPLDIAVGAAAGLLLGALAATAGIGASRATRRREERSAAAAGPLPATAGVGPAGGLFAGPRDGVPAVHTPQRAATTAHSPEGSRPPMHELLQPRVDAATDNSRAGGGEHP